MNDDQRWWFCLRHMAAEYGAGCPGKYRLGPYPTQQAAENALETVKRRNEEWEAQDRWPGEDGD